ncbi:MAG: alpha/beta hydrolase [Alphaproteobacteria bacterium]|jgi:pimeloyl-ACP methyl ester carboxylesterase|nr:alpha/beta hydrolase [Alphaproteobacteria bacterium]
MAGNSGTTTKFELPGAAVDVVRKGAGPKLFMLHGGGGPVTAMPFADKLAQSFEIIAPVHPGFAGSPIPEHFDDLQDLVFLYLDLMDALDLDDAIMMGFSFGGWTAAEIAVISTARISKLILVDPVGVKVGGREDRDIADVFATPPDELAKLMWHDASKAPNPARMTDTELETVQSNRVALALYTWQPYMHNPKLPGRLHRIDVPTLLIWGESDGLVTPDYGQAFCGMIPGAEMAVIPKAGHAPQAEQPDAFVGHVTAFA